VAPEAEGAAALVLAQCGIDPGLLEELRDQVAGALGEALIRTQDQLFGLLPGQLPAGRQHRRVAIPLVELVEAQKAFLDVVVAGDHRVAPADRLDQGLDRLVGGLVGEVAGAEPGGVLAQPIVDRLVLEDDIEDVGARPDVLAERLGDRFASLLPDGAVVVAEARQRLFQAGLLAAQLGLDRR